MTDFGTLSQPPKTSHFRERVCQINSKKGQKITSSSHRIEEKKKEIHFMLVVRSDVNPGKQHEAKHDVQTHFCFYDRHRQHRPFKHQPQQLMSAIKDQTFQHFPLISSNVKTFFSVSSRCFHSVFVSSSRPLFLKTFVHCPNEKNELA